MQSENLLSCHTLVRWCIGIVKSLLFESRKQIDVNTCLFSLLGVIEMVYLNVSVLRHNALSYSLNRISPLQIVAFVVVIVWWLDLKLPVQSVPIITKVVNSNPDHCEVFWFLIQHYVISLSVTCGRSVVFSGYSGFLHQ